MKLRVVADVEVEFVDATPTPAQLGNVERHACEVTEKALLGMSLRVLQGWRVDAVRGLWPDAPVTEHR